jgi:hypothetical protein
MTGAAYLCARQAQRFHAGAERLEKSVEGENLVKTCRTLFAGAARVLGAIALGVVLLGATSARAGSLQSQPNIVDLVNDAEIIIRGNVVEVTDGFDQNNLPYTQVKISVKETLRGNVSGEYTFRQFGLLKPREIDGKLFIGVTPNGWATYSANEDVVLFLYQAASLTGLRTTAGLNAGKFAVHGSNALSQSDNLGLFNGVTVDPSLLNDNDKRLFATKKGAVNVDSLLSFVRRAVNDKWIERGKMRRAN